MKLKSIHTLKAALAAILLAAGLVPVCAQSLQLNPPAAQPGQTPRAGSNVVVGDRFVLVSNTGDDQRGSNSGAVHVYNVNTGALLRTLRPADAAAEDLFGSSIALNNEIAVIGASQDDDRGTDSGSVYVFNVASGNQLAKFSANDGVAGDKLGSRVAIHGKTVLVSTTKQNGDRGAVYVINTSGLQLRKLTAADGAAGDFFGAAVALRGNLALIGASGDDEGTGSLYLVDVSTGVRLHKLFSKDADAGDRFGQSVSVSGDLALVGAPGDDELGSNAGAAYLLRLSSLNQLRKLKASDGNTTDFFGNAVSLQETIAVVGAPIQGSTKGQVYVFDAITGAELRKLAPTQRAIGDQFGSSVSTHAGRIAIGVPQSTAKSGFALLHAAEAVPVPALSVARRGESTPGIANATFNAFSAHLMNPNGQSLLKATVSGAGTRDTAVWNHLAGTLDLMVQKGESIDGPTVAEIQTQVMNHRSAAFARVRLAGAGVNTENDLQIVADNGMGLMPVIRESHALNGGGFTGQVVKQLKEVVASYEKPRAAFFTSFVTADTARDTGIAIFDVTTGIVGGLREGDAAPFAGTAVGQIAERVTFSGSSVIASVSLLGSAPATDAALLQVSPGLPTTAIVRKGDVAPGVSSATFTSFIAETSSIFNEPCFLAGISGPTATNQGIWIRPNQSTNLSLVLQKGAQVPGLVGVTFQSFTRFWALGFGQVMVQAKVQGSEVNSTNDELLFYVSGNRRVILMREGDIAPNCDGARLGAFTKVDADINSGTYTVLSALLGANAAQTTAITNSSGALWMGRARNTLSISAPGADRPEQVSTPDELLRPGIILRNGGLHIIGGASLRLTALDLQTAETTQGAGRGLGSTVGSSNAATVLTYGSTTTFAGQTLPAASE